MIDWTASPALYSGLAVPNRLQIERTDEQVRCFANDQLLAVLTLPNGIFNGQYGFVLASADDQGQASFDNLFGAYLPAQP